MTSPPEHCADPAAGNVEGGEAAVHLSNVLARFADPGSPGLASRVALPLALEWAMSHPDESPARPGPEWVERLFGMLSGREAPASVPKSTGSIEHEHSEGPEYAMDLEELRTDSPRGRRCSMESNSPTQRCCRSTCAGSRMRHARLSRLDLRGADLAMADLEAACLTAVNLRGSHLFGVNLARARLVGVDLCGANLHRARMSGAEMSGILLRAGQLPRADLRGAKLSQANLQGANLSHADLRDADLRGANLVEATLSHADLDRADFRGRGCLFDDADEELTCFHSQGLLRLRRLESHS